MTADFEDIRPYHDHEVRPVLDALIRDREFLAAIASFRYPKSHALLPALVRKLVQVCLRHQTRHVQNIHDIQIIIEQYLDELIETTTTSLTHTGLDKLDPARPYLFVSNHRDITMDPALVNYMLYHQGFDTLQIAIGDNLLKRPFLSDLMRLNKSFLVRRGVQGREKLRASKQLSAYIQHCIRNGQNVWIAQREGRAKDGRDKTETAVIKMLQLAQREENPDKNLATIINELNVVPVAISYELDPCDQYKAEELRAIDTSGKFVKSENSDIQSILAGMVGAKGDIHVAFGKPLLIREDVTAEVVAALIDAQIIENYRLHPSNYFAMDKIQAGFVTDDLLARQFQLAAGELGKRRADFEQRLLAAPAELRPYMLSMYANPVIAKHS